MKKNDNLSKACHGPRIEQDALLEFDTHALQCISCATRLAAVLQEFLGRAKICIGSLHECDKKAYSTRQIHAPDLSRTGHSAELVRLQILHHYTSNFGMQINTCCPGVITTGTDSVSLAWFTTISMIEGNLPLTPLRFADSTMDLVPIVEGDPDAVRWYSVCDPFMHTKMCELSVEVQTDIWGLQWAYERTS
ncbi:hypothetical protein B0H10DRAFT_1954318 [Mycena sp. CBHHK59/15]|nr:hypothetical protein B0H10DRAFT_1954318 [Mycena sp. CBHHK59/15]